MEIIAKALDLNKNSEQIKAKTKEQLERWKKQLIDFSRRNQLLYFKTRPSLTVEFKEQAVEIFQKLILESKNLSFIEELEMVNSADFGDEMAIPMDPDELEPGMTIDDLEPAGVDPMASTRSDLDYSTSLQTKKDSKTLDQALGKLRTRAAASMQEQGVNILYMAVYFLEWDDHKSAQSKKDDNSAKSPLLLMPVNLSRRGLSGAFSMSAIEDEIRINPTLSYKLHRDYGIDLSPFETELNEAIAETDNSKESQEEFNKTLAEIMQKIEVKISEEHPEWKVVDESCLSVFSFAKLSLYRDIEDNEDTILDHPVIRQIAGEIIPDRELEQDLDLKYLVKAEEIDIKVDANESRQILDADSSQEEAIYASKAGKSFVIQGPPGTGKSQTISNIIAEALSQNKKILFVSEKKSALEVVVNRLKQSKLDRFCLELHNSQQKKSEVINNLRLSVDSLKELALEVDRDEHVENINQIKNEINKSLSELHRLRMPVNKTLYEIYGELAHLNAQLNNLNIEFTIPNIEKVDLAKLSELDFFFKKLASHSKIICNYDDFIWRNADVKNLSFEVENDIKSNLIEFKNILDKLESYANPISEKYFHKPTRNLKEFKWLADASGLAINSPFPKKEWFNTNTLDEVQTLTIEAKIEHEEYRTDKGQILSKYSEAFLDLDHNELVTKFTQKFTGIFRFLNFDYWKTISEIKKMALYNESRDLKTIVNDLQHAAQLDKKAHEIAKEGTELSLQLGDFYNEFDTNWDETITAINWVKKVMGKFDTDALPGNFVEIITENKKQDDYKNFEMQAQELVKANELVNYHINAYRKIFPRPNLDIESLSFEELKDHIEDLIENLIDIEAWVEFKSLVHQAKAMGMGQFIESLITADLDDVNADMLFKIFIKKLYQLWVDKIEMENPVMRKFTGANQEIEIERFNEIDQQIIKRNNKGIAKELAMNWIEYAANTNNKADMQVLNHEINKKKKHKPMRVLVKEIPELLQTLKPCWMMSPLSVAQLIENESQGDFKVNFDLVIFDEASQIRTEDAICSIYRAKQLILAGDSNQLPPTNFFNYIAEDDDYENNNFESVLDECAVFLDSKTLNWHYRSRHEDLIKFSNYNIYDNQLITFPSPITGSDAYGVDFEAIEKGYYEKGSRFNRREAQRVAQAIIEHYSQNPDKSLGVIAFSEAQQFAIERELGKELRKDAEMQEKMTKHMDEEKTDSLFIKNLENVQGDERDVIFFSIGYARDKQGNLSHNFGPLNREGGHRRLNVAVTRARNKLKVFSSIISSDIDPSRTSSQGAMLLKKYLAFAENCAALKDRPEEITTPSLQEDPEMIDEVNQHDSNDMVEEAQKALLDDETSRRQNEFRDKLQASALIEESIANYIQAQGFEIEMFLGSSDYRVDIAVKSKENPGEYILAIETDGVVYRTAKTTRDRERLRRQVLKSLGWKTHKIWARDWIRNNSVELEKLESALAIK